MYKRQWIILLLLPVVLGCASCQWHEAKEVIAMADSIDQTQHVIYDDTAALGGVIRTLDNPLGKLLMSNTLGKAYYYMGRNLEDCYEQFFEAAECYIEADRLRINDPIFRGRVNSCIGHMCGQNSTDSIAIFFYERAYREFKNSGNDWRYAQSILNLVSYYSSLHMFTKADSLLQIAQTYQLDSIYQARYYETQGLYFYAKQQYDSALIYFKQGLNYWQDKEDKCFSYLRLMQIYVDLNDFHQAIPCAQYIIKYSVNPNYLVNAYYCLMQEAESKNDMELLSYYSHARMDAHRILHNSVSKSSETIPILKEHMINPYPLRGMKIALWSIAIACLLCAIGIAVYRRFATNRIQVSTEQITSLSVQVKEQQEDLSRYYKIHHYDKCLDKIRRRFPNPPKHWNNYKQLKKDINPYLHHWLTELEKFNLTDREKVFCVYIFIYSQISTKELAKNLYITEEAVAVRKTRIAKKIGITSTQLADFLRNILNHD